MSLRCNIHVRGNDKPSQAVIASGSEKGRYFGTVEYQEQNHSATVFFESPEHVKDMIMCLLLLNSAWEAKIKEGQDMMHDAELGEPIA